MRGGMPDESSGPSTDGWPRVCVDCVSDNDPTGGPFGVSST